MNRTRDKARTVSLSRRQGRRWEFVARGGGGGGEGVAGAVSRVPKTRALKTGLGISSPRKVKNLEANNLAVCIYLQIFQPLI